MTERHDEERALSEWSRRLTQALQILDLQVDHSKLLELAEKSAESVTPSAGPISTFVVGYAAGLANTTGTEDANDAVRSAADVALQLCADGTAGGPAGNGWADTAQ